LLDFFMFDYKAPYKARCEMPSDGSPRKRRGKHAIPHAICKVFRIETLGTRVLKSDDGK